MNPSQQQAILTIALLAAFADGAKDEREREEIRSIADSLAGESGSAQLSTLYQDVLLKRVDVAKDRSAARLWHRRRCSTSSGTERPYDNSFQVPSETTSTVPSTTWIAVWSSIA